MYCSVSYAESINTFNTKCFKSDDGLPQNSITDIALASDGQLIISTYLGIVAFDGSRFSNFIPQTDLQFPNEETYDLEVASDGTIYVGTTTNGLYRFKGNSIQHWGEHNGLTNKNVVNIVITQDGVYVQNDDYLSYFNHDLLDKLVPLELPSGLVDSNFFIFNLNKELALASGESIWLRKQGSFIKQTITLDGLPISGTIFGLADPGNVFYLENNGHIYEVKNNKARLLISDFIKDSSLLINTLKVDSENNLWIATENHGLMRFGSGQLETLLGTENVRTASILESNDGTIWFGGSNGLCFLKENAIQNIGQEQGLIKENIRFLSVGEKDTVYALNQDFQKYYYSIQDNQVQAHIFNLEPATNNEMIYAIASKGDKIWLSTNSRIIEIVDQKSNTLIQLKGRSRSLLSRDDVLWFIDGDDLVRYSNNKLDRFFIKENSDIHAIDFAYNGDLLVSEKQSVYRLKDEVLEKIEMPLNYSSCIHEFNKDELWVCGEGLWFKSNDKSYHFDSTHGLTHGHVHDLVEDEFGNIWVISNVGLYRLLREDIDEILNGKSVKSFDTTLFTRFTEKDGMKSSEFNGSAYSAVKTSDGRLWFSSQKGIVVVNPTYKDLNKEKILNPFIEHVFVGQDRIPKSHWLKISPNPETVQFHISSVSLTNSLNISYRYKLSEAKDSDWKLGKIANFTGLNPNTYRLVVQARQNNNPWSPSLITEFQVLPTWYQTFAFRIFAIILAIMILIGLPYWRFYRLKNKAYELKALVDQQTSSLTEANNKLKIIANNDELTGIANRRVFMRTVSHWKDKFYDDLVLALIDVDDFKAFNDFYGHIKGDECLLQVAQTLDKHSSDNCVVARYGGEEFVVLFKQVGHKKAQSEIHEIIKEIANQAIPHKKSKVSNCISLSIGLVCYQESESIEKFIERADEAMYEAKARGKNQLISKL